jgi:2-polyprenyl-3-methyl-5-hydroxy-6-metoxy-1,4-benzoquinol methylase
LLSDNHWWRMLTAVIDKLHTASLDYTLLGSSALFAQGVLSTAPDNVEISIQWDLMPRVSELFQTASEIEHLERYELIHAQSEKLEILCYGFRNAVVVTDPDRLAIEHEGQHIWVKALDYYLHTLAKNDPSVQAIKSHLQSLQRHNSLLNQAAWNEDAYAAWIHRHGTPEAMAERICKDPWSRLSSLSRQLGPLTGKKVINLLGSHGAKAIAMALLGADVTIVDIAQENARYACEVASAAGVTIRYIIADVLQLSDKELDSSYDLVLMELGILHYFIDLEPLARVVEQLLQVGGRLVLQDFHPLTTKLIVSRGKKHKVEANYFDKTLIVKNVAVSKHLPDAEQKTPQRVYLRQWTLGEIVSAFAAAGLFIRSLEEEPNSKIDDIGLPKTFTLVAEKLFAPPNLAMDHYL